MVLFAALMTSLAALTAILAIGSGRHWNFTVGDYFRGKRNAILYLWVTVSAAFAICHSGVIVEHGLKHGWQADTGNLKWFIIHSVAGILFVCAHLFVAATLSKEVGPVDKYLWGKKRRAVQ